MLLTTYDVDDLYSSIIIIFGSESNDLHPNHQFSYTNHKFSFKVYSHWNGTLSIYLYVYLKLRFWQKLIMLSGGWGSTYWVGGRCSRRVCKARSCGIGEGIITILSVSLAVTIVGVHLRILTSWLPFLLSAHQSICLLDHHHSHRFIIYNIILVCWWCLDANLYLHYYHFWN